MRAFNPVEPRCLPGVFHLLFWGLIASMWVGNLMLLVINLPLIHVWVALLKTPYRLMFPAILLFCCIGVYSINNTWMDVILAAGPDPWRWFISMNFMDCEPSGVVSPGGSMIGTRW